MPNIPANKAKENISLILQNGLILLLNALNIPVLESLYRLKVPINAANIINKDKIPLTDRST